MSTRVVSDEELDYAVHCYLSEGWALLPSVATAETLANLRERAGDLCSGRVPDPGLFFQAEGATGRYEDVAKVPGWVGPDRWYRKVEKLERDERYLAWLQNDVFARIAARVHPGAVHLYRAVLFTKAPRIGSDTPWHQDAGRLWGLDHDPQLQLWTALDDAPLAAGGLEVVPRSHLDGLVTPLGGVIPNPDRSGLGVPARAGDVVLVHNLTWHRAGPNQTDGVRRAFTACLLPATTRCIRTRKAARTFPRIF